MITCLKTTTTTIFQPNARKRSSCVRRLPLFQLSKRLKRHVFPRIGNVMENSIAMTDLMRRTAKVRCFCFVYFLVCFVLDNMNNNNINDDRKNNNNININTTNINNNNENRDSNNNLFNLIYSFFYHL